MTSREIRAARIKAISEKYKCNPRGKYIVETLSRISNSWIPVRYRFDDIEDAKKYVMDRKDIYNDENPDPARIIHYNYIDENSARIVVDWKEL